MFRNVNKITGFALFASAALLLAAPASAVTVRIDFEAFDGTPAAGWNMIDSGDSNTTVDLFDSTGIDSGIDIALPSLLDNNGAFDAWNDANALPAWAPDSAADDYVYIVPPGPGFFYTFVFSGLDPALFYDIDLIVSRDLARSQDMRMAGGNGNFDEFDWDSQADGWVSGNVISWAGIAPTAAGVINFFVRRDSNSAALNAMQIVSIPEPSPLFLFAGAGVWLARRRSSASLPPA